MINDMVSRKLVQEFLSDIIQYVKCDIGLPGCGFYPGRMCGNIALIYSVRKPVPGHSLGNYISITNQYNLIVFQCYIVILLEIVFLLHYNNYISHNSITDN